MSTRQLPKITLGAVALLLLATGGFILSQQGRQESHLAQIRLVQDQPQLIEELSQDVARLSAAATLVDVNQDRYRLGSVVVRFDQVLSALLHGGYLENDSGPRLQVAKVEPAETRDLLENAARIWLETGVPLADLAAGEFSIFSSAGQEAIRSLETNKAELASLFQQMKISLEQSQVQQQATLAYARWSAAGLGAVLLVLGFLIWRAGRPRPQARTADNPPARSTRNDRETGAPQTVAGLGYSRPSVTAPAVYPYTSPVDFGNLNASVDQISVDLGTIANSTEKMRQAIEAVGHGMQGLLHSLKETASSTAEDARILHNANNAAGFTAESSDELTTSAREMSKVVDRVSQLALKTKQIAGSLEIDSIQLDPESDTHTSVVAAEILQLAQQTARTTEEIELTVSTIMTTARLYDEAIGQIIKNVSKINQISQNMGCMIKAGPPILTAPPRANQAPLAVQRPLAPAAPVEAAAPAPPPPPAPDPEPEAADAGPSITDELSAALSAIKDVQTVAPELNRSSGPEDDPVDEDDEAADLPSSNVFIFDTSALSTDEDAADEEAIETAPGSGTRVFIEPENEEIDLTAIEALSAQDEPQLDEPQLDEPQLDEPQQSAGSEAEGEKEDDHAAQENPNVFVLP